MSVPEYDTFAKARESMVARQLRARGIGDERVCQAMSEIPREHFVPFDVRHAAYEDRALPIECDQTISQPYMVAVMTQALRVQPDHRVLEIGTGSGYQTAVLAKLARRVITVERIAILARQAKVRLDELGLDNVFFVIADGSGGLAAVQPGSSPASLAFDRILVTAGAPEVPEPLVEQLTDGGRMVVPVGAEAQQNLLAVDRKLGRTSETSLLPCRFVKLIGRGGW